MKTKTYPCRVCGEPTSKPNSLCAGCVSHMVAAEEFRKIADEEFRVQEIQRRREREFGPAWEGKQP